MLKKLLQRLFFRELVEQNRHIIEINADLHAQNTELRQSRLLSPQEDQDIKTLRSEFDRLNVDVNKLGQWLRDNKSQEIKQGRHMGMSLAEVCIMYMARGLDK